MEKMKERSYSLSNYVERLVIPLEYADICVRVSALYSHRMDGSGDSSSIENLLAGAGGKTVMLLGGHRPLEDQFPVADLKQVAKRFTHNEMQACQVFRQYGELLGMELRMLGYSVLSVAVVCGDKFLFADNLESNANGLAAFWSGLRIEGVAIGVELPPARNGGVDWDHVRPALISGAPFVTISHGLATSETWHQLMENERFSGVACVSGLAATGLHGVALAEDAARLLNMGWHALVLDDLDLESLQSLYAMLAEMAVACHESHEDSLGRIGKRRDMLAAIEERGKGLVALDRDPDYVLKRRLLSHKLGIEDAYAFQERPARPGSMARFQYRLFIDGGLRDENQNDGMRVILGKGQIISGLEDELINRRKGDRFIVEIPPEKAYGVIEDSLIIQIPRNGIMLAPGQRLQPGGRAVIPREGEALEGRIVEVQDDVIIVDTNHELAGKSLTFEVVVMDVI